MYKEDWRANFAQSKDFYLSNSEESAFKSWESSKMIVGTIELAFDSAITCYFGDADVSLVRRFLERSRLIHQRAVEEERYSKEGLFPYNRAYANLLDELAAALLDDRPPDPVVLKWSFDDFRTYRLTDRRAMDANMWGNCLDVAEAFLVAGDAKGCSAVLKFVGAKPKLAERIPLDRWIAKGTDFENLELRTQFSRHFDELRKRTNVEAAYNRSLAFSLLWGAIYDLYLLGNRPLSWERAIAVASA